MFSGYDPETGHLRHHLVDVRGRRRSTPRPATARATARTATARVAAAGRRRRRQDTRSEGEESSQGAGRRARDRWPRRRHGARRGAPGRDAAAPALRVPGAQAALRPLHPRDGAGQVCGVPPETFLEVCEAVTANSGRDRTTSWVYSVGWTHHTVGVQYIRGSAIIQLLLGNMGRPGGGILALRGHASIQGSTDIPTLFNLLPGYLPMPKAGEHDDPARLHRQHASAPSRRGSGAHADAYTVSLLKSYWGDAATADNDFAFDYLPRLTGDHGTYQTVMDMLDDKVEGYLLFGQNPAVGSAHGQDAAARHGAPEVAGRARPRPDRDGDLLEGRPGDRDRRAADRGHRHRGVLLPGRLARGEGRLVHPDPADAAVAPQGGRAARRRPQRAAASSSTSAARSASGWPARPSSATGRCST